MDNLHMIYPYLLLNCSCIEYLEILNGDEIWGHGELFLQSVTGCWVCYSAFREHFLHFDRRSSLKIKDVMVIKYLT